MCEECYSYQNRITPLINPKECLQKHTQYICGTCGRCICIEKDSQRGVQRWNFPFRSLEIAEFDTAYTSVENDMTIAGLPVTDLSVLYVQENRRLTLPSNAEFSDTTSAISYDLPAEAPEHAAAQITYDYGGHTVGTAYLMVGRKSPEILPSIAEIPV